MKNKHGNERNSRMVTESRNTRIFVAATGGKIAVIMPTSSFSRTVSEKFCVKCGWINCDGIGGYFAWIAEHEKHENESSGGRCEFQMISY